MEGEGKKEREKTNKVRPAPNLISVPAFFRSLFSPVNFLLFISIWNHPSVLQEGRNITTFLHLTTRSNLLCGFFVFGFSDTQFATSPFSSPTTDTMAEEQKPVEVPKEETPATTTAATEAAPATETKAEETVAPAAGTCAVALLFNLS